MGGLFGGGSSSPGVQPSGVGGAYQYIPTGQKQEDTSLQALLNQLMTAPNYPAQNLPQITAQTNAQINSPYAAGAQTAANNAGTILQGVAGADTSAAEQLQPYESEVLNTAFDPQNALFNQETNQLQQQTNAQNSMYGLGTSPVGASITDNALGNFDINWQNNELNREATGTQLAGTLGQDVNSLGSAGATAAQNAGALPAATYTGNINTNLTDLQNLNNAGVATQAMPTTIMDYLQSYLGLGQTANNAANANSQASLASLVSGATGLAGAAATAFGPGTTINTAAPAASTVGQLQDVAPTEAGSDPYASDYGDLSDSYGDQSLLGGGGDLSGTGVSSGESAGGDFLSQLGDFGSSAASSAGSAFDSIMSLFM